MARSTESGTRVCMTFYDTFISYSHAIHKLALPRQFLLVLVLSCMRAALAQADCASDLAEARAIAGSLHVSIEAPQRPRVGAPIKVIWTKGETARAKTPLYLVLTAPAEVRFAGTGFAALTADAKGPHNLAYGAKAARALVALYRPSDTAKDGEISVLPYRRGAQNIAWAAVTAGSCGEQVLVRGEKTVEVAPGPPEIVVQDLFATSAPLKRLASPAGTYELLVFKDRYEVFEAATGSRILSRAAVGANFSPTGRFVTARRPADEKLEVVDVESGRVVAESERDGALGWVHGDSYLVYAASRAGKFIIWNAIADGKSLLEEELFACMACMTFESVDFALDFDRGFLVASSGHDGIRVADLFTRVVEPRTDAEYDGLLSQMKIEEAQRHQRQIAAFGANDGAGGLAFILRIYNPSLAAIRKGWNFGEKIAFSTVPSDAEEAKQFRESPTTTLVRPKAVSGERVATATSGKSNQLRASPRAAIALDGATTANQTRTNTVSVSNAPDVVFPRLANEGIPTQTPITLAQMPIDARKQAEDEGQSIAGQVRALVPAAGGIFRKGFQCSFEDAPGNGVLVDPSYIDGIWRWRDNGTERLLLQVICPQGAAGRYVMSELFVLQPSGSAKVTQLVGDEDTIFDSSDKDVRLQIVRLGEHAFAVANGLRGTVAIIDLAAGKRIGPLIPLLDASLLSEYRLTADGNHLVQLNRDGRFFVHRIADGKRVLIGAYVDDEIVVANDDGLYDTTYEGAQSVQVRFPGSIGLFRFNQFEATLRRTKLAAAVLSGANLAPPDAVPVPPTAEFTLNATVTNGRRLGTVIARSERELSAVRLYIDGRLHMEIPIKGTRVEVPVDIPDPGGGRWITAVVVDSQGLVSQPNAVQLPGALRPHGTLRAVAIGIDNYQDPALPRLNYAKADAQRLSRALKASERHAVQSVQVTSLLDAQVTPERIVASVREAAKSTGPDDTLLVFYAGHGIDGRSGEPSNTGLVLATAATRMKDLKATSVSWAELADALAEARGTIVVILDACHAGIAGSDAFATNDAAVSALMTRAGSPMVILAGSKGRQFSYEDAKAGGGVFTAAIAAAISEARATYDRDRNGLIDLGELYSAVKTKVFDVTRGKQTPWLVRNALVGEMALF
jgi:hypothetical protein